MSLYAVMESGRYYEDISFPVLVPKELPHEAHVELK